MLSLNDNFTYQITTLTIKEYKDLERFEQDILCGVNRFTKSLSGLNQRLLLRLTYITYIQFFNRDLLS